MTAASGEDPVRIAIVAARFNGEIVDRLVSTALDELERAGVAASDIVVCRVPGSFELATAAQALLHGPKPPDAVICLGAVIRGETPHFEYVATAAAHGILRVALDARRPVIFGVLTVETIEQAWDRAEGRCRRGAEAASAALEMAALLRDVARGGR